MVIEKEQLKRVALLQFQILNLKFYSAGVSAGTSTGASTGTSTGAATSSTSIADFSVDLHLLDEWKVEKEDDAVKGDEQFEIDDNRSFETMYKDMSGEGLQPVLNDYVYV